MIERYSRPEMKRVWADENKFGKWLQVEIAVCEAWTELGVIPKSAIPRIKMARLNLKRMEELLQKTHHDVTAFLGAIGESVGEEARYIHLGLTSSDVMDTALGLQMVEASEILLEDVNRLIDTLAEKALKYKYTPMMGRTHGIHAEPISFGLKLALWLDEMRRNRQRLSEARKVIAYGKLSGAVGTFATLTPEIEEKVCARLKLTPAPVSSQILQRDRHAQFLCTLALIGTSLDKFATEIRALQKTEVREVEEPFAAGQTGSSAMPHKRNPELCERVSGLARLLRGFSLTAMENMVLWHERDISHSSAERVIIPDACFALNYMLNLFTGIMKELNVYPEKMKSDLDITRGLIFSQRVMLALIDKGLSREKAYEITQRNAMKVWQSKRKRYLTLLKADPELKAVLPGKELEALFDIKYYLRYVDEIFGRMGLTGNQWQKVGKEEAPDLAPRSL